MKVFLVADYIPGYHNWWSGAEILCLRLSEMLRRRSQSVEFVTTTFDKYHEYEGIHQIPTFKLNASSLFERFPFDPIATYGCLNVFRKSRPDIVHIHGHILFFPALIAAKILGIPIVNTIIDYWTICPKSTLRNIELDGTGMCPAFHGTFCARCFPKDIALPTIVKRNIGFIRFLIFDRSLQEIDGLIALSNTSKRLMEQYGVPPDKIRAIHYFRVPGVHKVEPSKYPIIMFVGKLEASTGLHIIIEAMPKVVKHVSNTRLIVVGSGDARYEDEMKEKVEKLGLNDNIKFLGRRRNEEVLSLYAQCTVAVVPEQWPNDFGPLVLIEALMMGRPVVAGRIGSNLQLGLPEESGRIYGEGRYT